MLMALLPLAGWAADLDLSKFTAANINYGATALPAVSQTQGLTENTHYTVETTKFYTGENGEGETALASLSTAAASTKYYMKVTGIGDYDGQVIYVSFWINGVAVTIDFAASQKKTYGADDPATFTYTLKKGGSDWTDTDNTLGLTVGRVAGEDVVAAGYAFTFSASNPNYSLTRATGDDDVFTIEAKNISSTAVITAWQADVVYTGKDITGVYTVLPEEGGTALTAGDDYTVSTTKDASTTEFCPTITFAGNYTGTLAVAAGKGFKVNKAPITVSCDDIEITYDGNDKKDVNYSGSATFSYSGIIGDDVTNAANIKAAFTAPTTVKVGSTAKNKGDYTLTISGGSAGTGLGKNYEFTTYLPATLTINPIELSIAAAAASKNFGDADPTFELATDAPSGIVSGYKVSGVTFTRTEGEEIGSYDITPDVSAAKVKKNSTDDTSNYTFKIATPKAQLTINQAAIVVTIKDAEKFYGEADPEFKYVVSGLKSGDELADFEITREDNEAVGAYNLTATVANPDAEKYASVTVVPGILTIKKAQLTFTIPTQTIEKTATVTALSKSTITVTGINNDDTAADLYDLSFNATAGEAVDVDTDGKTTTDKTYTKGIVATLTAAAQTSYEIITDATSTPVTTGTSITGKLIVGTGTATALAFTSVNADAATIAEHAGETQTVTIQFGPRNGRNYGSGDTYSWKAGQWTTMVLPFDISVSDLSKALGYAIVNVIDPTRTTVSGEESKFYGKLTMKGGNGNATKLAANKPFLIKLAEDIDGTTAYNFGSQKIVAADDLSVDAGGGAKFVGTYATKTVTKDDDAAIWFMNGDEDGWQFIGSSSTATWSIVPFEAYIDMSTSSAPRNIIFYAEEIDGSVTAIKGISTDAAAKAKVAEGWYTINGVKLNAAPTQKGIYINNGKKFVVK